jgi:ribosomal protein S10
MSRRLTPNRQDLHRPRQQPPLKMPSRELEEEWLEQQQQKKTTQHFHYQFHQRTMQLKSSSSILRNISVVHTIDRRDLHKMKQRKNET